MYACRQAAHIDRRIREGEASTKQMYLKGTYPPAGCMVSVSISKLRGRITGAASVGLDRAVSTHASRLARHGNSSIGGVDEADRIRAQGALQEYIS